MGVVLVIYPLSHICPSEPIAYAMCWDCEASILHRIGLHCWAGAGRSFWMLS